MSTTIDGTTGISQVQDGIVGTNKLAAGAVTPVKTQVGATPSMVRLNTANGYGSTNTAIRRFTNTVTNQGSDITYADSATNGASFTINTNGVYAVSYTDQFSAASTLGISLNSNQLTTAIESITASNRMCSGYIPAANTMETVTVTAYLSAGDVVRAHAGASTGNNSALAQFTIARVA